MSAASLRAGTITVIEGSPVGDWLNCGRRRLGMRGRPRAAAMACQSQVSAISQARSERASCRRWLKQFAATLCYKVRKNTADGDIGLLMYRLKRCRSLAGGKIILPIGTG